MSRDLISGLSALTTAAKIEPFFAVRIFFDTQTLNFWSGLGDMNIDGVTYTGTGKMLQISDIGETAEIAAKGAVITLSGIPSDLLSLAISEPYQGRECRIFFGAKDVSVDLLDAENTDDIERFAEQFITLNFETDENDELDVKAHNIDPRVNVSACSEPLMGNLSTKRRSRSQIVEVSCPSPDTPWKMYVPVKIRHMVPVVVSLVQLDKGARINENNIEVVYRDKMSLRRQAHTNTDKFYGAKTKRRVSAGQIIGRQNICFVCKYLVLFICTCVSLLQGTHTSNFNCLSYQLFVGVENEGNKMGSR